MPRNTRTSTNILERNGQGEKSRRERQEVGRTRRRAFSWNQVKAEERSVVMAAAEGYRIHTEARPLDLATVTPWLSPVRAIP